MAFRSKLAKAEPALAGLLAQSPGRIYSRVELKPLHSRARDDGLLAKHTSLDQVIDHLTRHHHLLPITLSSAEYGKALQRYSAGRPHPYALAISIRRSGYLSHATAAHLHQLLPTSTPIYLNIEQSAKPVPAQRSLSQPAIDRAFAGKQRQSNLSYRNGDFVCTILAGKNTRRAGVELSTHPAAKDLPVTNLERTLIDITVRPGYAGGIPAVLTAYRAARERVDISKLVAILDHIDHAYPFAQSIGFLMRLADYPKDALTTLKSRQTAYDFYLAYGMRETAYDSDWRIHYPRDLR
ncbi:MAG: hypothetical protein WDO56_12200 [Gammaproteobacteria bacterium]